MDANQMGQDMVKLTAKMKNFMANDLPTIVKVEGLAHIKKSFREEGFTDGALQKWKPRATEKNKKSLTRYRTSRKGKEGALNAYGRKNQNRPILVGYNSGNKLRNSFRAKTSATEVVFFTHKIYAEFHNKGTKKLPKRQFMGPSRMLNKAIHNKIERTLKRIAP